jgi:hypothetical protein
MTFDLPPVVRPADAGDLDAIVALTKIRRVELAGWEELYWRPRAGIDELHPHFLRWCIEQNASCAVSVATEGERIVGCLFVHTRPDHRFFDDFCVVDGRWSDVGSALVDGAESVGLICAPTKDLALNEWLQTTGNKIVSRFFSLLTVDSGEVENKVNGLPPLLPAAPRHVFGPIDATTENGLRVVTSHGYAVGSAPMSPPPFDPGGPTTVVDQIVGRDRVALLDQTLSAAKRRGDVQVIVVCAEDDHELAAVLVERCVSQPVNLWEWRR